MILTGANRDGARGLAAIKARGGITVVEDPVAAACAEMPEAALAQTRANWILPLPEIAQRLQLLSEISSLHGLPSRRTSETVGSHGS